MNTDKLGLRIACSTLALVCAAAATPAWAQAEAAGDPVAGAQTVSVEQDKAPAVAAPDDQDGDEEIVVTGTNISGVKPVGNTAIVLTREDAIKSGYSTPAELLRTLPQNRPSEYEGDSGLANVSLQNSGGGNTIDLRGLGGSGGRSSTLLLIDGRRTVQFGTNQAGTEANQVPLAAIDRVEIIADGASAIYGADAVAGVVNYVLRKDYDGAELTFRGNNNSGGFEYGFDATLGTKWNAGGLGSGNILISYGYSHRDAYIAGKNPYLRYDGRSIGGLDRRLSGNGAFSFAAPNIVVNIAGVPNTALPAAGTNVYYGVPEGSAVGLTVGQLRPNDPNLTDISLYQDFVGRNRRHQLALYFNQELGDRLELFVQGNYLNREQHTRTPQAGSTPNVLLRRFLRNTANQVTTNLNPYYIAGIPGVAANADLTVQMPLLNDFGPRRQFGSDHSYNVTAGLRARLPGGWKGEAFYTYGRNEGCSYCVTGNYTNTAALQYQIDIGNINPLSSVPLTAAQIASFTGRQAQFGHNGIDDAVVKFNGPLFELPGGAVRAAVGGERLKSYNYNRNTSVTGINNVATTLTTKANSYYDRTVWSAFGEVYVPLVSEDMNVPMIKSLVVNAAARYDDYSDVGKTTNPKFGVTWDVADILSFYGSWGTSYVAPTLIDKNLGAYQSALFLPLYPQAATGLDPRFAPVCFSATACFAQGVLVTFGSNPNLRPQTATQWTLGAEFRPFRGFKAHVNYFNIDYQDRIVFPQTLAEFQAGRTGSPPGYRGYDDLIVGVPACVNGQPSAVLQQILDKQIYAAGSGVGSVITLADACAVRGILNSSFSNLSRTKTDGLDMDVDWTGTFDEVTLNANALANVILHNSEIITPGAPKIKRLGLLGDPPNPLKWRGRASLGAAYHGFAATLYGNYYGKFINNLNLVGPANSLGPQVEVPAYTTFDLNLSYFTDMAGRGSFLKGLRGSLTFLNVFDRNPQVIINKSPSATYLAGRGSPFGRTISFSLTGSF